MASIKVKLTDLAPALKKSILDKRGAALKALQVAVKSHGPRLAMEEITKVQPEPTDRGNYKRSFATDDTPGGAIFYNSSPYAGIIEEGRRPGSKPPPVDVIAAWLKRKKIGAGTPAQIKGMAFVVARAIGRRGLPAHKILAKVSVRLGPLVADAVTKAIEKDTK